MERDRCKQRKVERVEKGRNGDTRLEREMRKWRSRGRNREDVQAQNQEKKTSLRAEHRLRRGLEPEQARLGAPGAGAVSMETGNVPGGRRNTARTPGGKGLRRGGGAGWVCPRPSL